MSWMRPSIGVFVPVVTGSVALPGCVRRRPWGVVGVVLAALVLVLGGPGSRGTSGQAGIAAAGTTVSDNHNSDSDSHNNNNDDGDGDLGFDAGATDGTGRNVTGEKAQSKVWSHDGATFAVLRNTAAHRYEIHRLAGAQGAQQWVTTGAIVSWRGDTRADVLPEGDTLWIATHHLASSNLSTGTLPAELRAYDYDGASQTYVPRAGFPSVIDRASSESLSLARDSAGTLWASWTKSRAVQVASSVDGGRTWSASAPVPLPEAITLDGDDISDIVWTGDRVLVAWSNQSDDAFYVSEHLDGAPVGSWSPAVAMLQGEGMVDDHLALASATDAGETVAVVKTGLDFVPDGAGVVLLRRDASTGGWSEHQVSTSFDCLTRPVVLLDTAGWVHVLATAPTDGVCTYPGKPGQVVAKSAPLDAPEFGAGVGVPVLRSTILRDLNNVTLTHAVGGAEDAPMLLASSEAINRYWSGSVALADLRGPEVTDPPGDGPTASFSTDLSITVHDTSTGGTAREWDFGDGTTSTEASPTHAYAEPGTYTVTLTVSSDSGVSTATQEIEVSDVVVQP